ncbi:MAG: hypothetical protein JNK82_18440, partial [Myxococcaceae bacterium]|nr:hypothetical protein [Myxococcaceae bacterium]
MRAGKVALLLVTVLVRPAFGADVGAISVLQHDGSAYDDGAAGLASRERAARAFFATHDDAYDFLIVFPTFPASWGAIEVNGLHSLVRNAVVGIGKPLVDNGAQFGSRS